MSDKSGAENIWSADPASGTPKDLTHFTSGRVLWPTISYDGKTIVFERGFPSGSSTRTPANPKSCILRCAASLAPQVSRTRL